MFEKQSVNKTFNYMKNAYKINKNIAILEKYVKNIVDETRKI